MGLCIPRPLALAAFLSFLSPHDILPSHISPSSCGLNSLRQRVKINTSAFRMFLSDTMSQSGENDKFSYTRTSVFLFSKSKLKRQKRMYNRNQGWECRSMEGTFTKHAQDLRFSPQHHTHKTNKAPLSKSHPLASPPTQR